VKGLEPTEIVTEHLRDWLRRGMSGCLFAAQTAADAERVGYLVVNFIGKAALDHLEELIVGSGEKHQLTIAVFPQLRSPSDVAKQLLRPLGLRERWNCRRVAGQFAHDCAGVGLTWRIDQDTVSSVMGLAPFGQMPTMRRAPYVCLVVWGGGYENSHKKAKPKGTVGLIDLPTGLNKAGYDAVMASTTARVNELSVLPKESPKLLRDVAFVLPRRVVTTDLRGVL